MAAYGFIALNFIIVNVLFFASHGSSQKIVTIPLKKSRDDSGFVILHDAYGSGELFHNRTLQEPPALHHKYKDYKYFQYYGGIEIGTPPQKFHVSFNPGQRLALIPSVKLKNKCEGRFNAFDAYSSHSFRDIGEAVILEGRSVQANISKDIIHIGKYRIVDQYFGHVQDGICENNLLYDGTVGLGFSNNYLTLLDNMVKQNLLSSSIVGLYLDRNVKTTKGGEVVLGYWNPKLVEKPNSTYYIPITNPSNPTWQIEVFMVHIGEYQITFDTLAILDTRSFYIDVPRLQAQNIADKIGAHNYKGNLIIDCNQVSSLPNLTITIHGISYTLEGKDYVDMENSYRSQCIVFIRSVEDVVWTLGGAFLGKYYTIFNYETKKVAFAKLIPPSRGSSMFISTQGLLIMLLLSWMLK